MQNLCIVSWAPPCSLLQRIDFFNDRMSHSHRMLPVQCMNKPQTEHLLVKIVSATCKLEWRSTATLPSSFVPPRRARPVGRYQLRTWSMSTPHPLHTQLALMWRMLQSIKVLAFASFPVSLEITAPWLLAQVCWMTPSANLARSAILPPAVHPSHWTAPMFLMARCKHVGVLDQMEEPFPSFLQCKSNNFTRNDRRKKALIMISLVEGWVLMLIVLWSSIVFCLFLFPRCPYLSELVVDILFIYSFFCFYIRSSSSVARLTFALAMTCIATIVLLGMTTWGFISAN